MILRRANPLLGPLEGVQWALDNSTFLGPNDTRFTRCHFRVQKSLDFQAPPPSNGPCNGYCPPQNHYVPRHINNRYINSYFTRSPPPAPGRNPRLLKNEPSKKYAVHVSL